MIKVSIIIPVYGVEMYIERCARSLFEQTLEEIEYIFVDDCTPDKSIQILQEVLNDYPNRVSNTRIVKMQTNSGLHNVRKEGLKYATGEFIAHCDSDDWVNKKMYKSMYEFAVLNHFDIVKCQYIRTDGINGKLIKLLKGSQNKEQIVSELLSRKGWNCIWDKIAKRELYMRSDMVFPPATMLEDFVISTQLIINANSFGVLDDAFYYYYDNPNSISGSMSKQSILKRSKEAKVNIELITRIVHNKYSNFCFKQELIVLKCTAKALLVPIMNEYESYKYWKDTYPEIDIPIIVHRLLPKVSYLQYLLICFRVYPIYKKMIHR
jgi:glycosyltransferase involved in cell wall biosynthesis